MAKTDISETKKSRSKRGPYKKDSSELQLVGVDTDMTLYELTDLFYSYYRYHNEECLVDYTSFVVDPKTRKPLAVTKSLPRYSIFRRLEALRLGSRPFLSGEGIAAHKPNVSLSYFNLFTTYSVLPYKSLFTDSKFVKVLVNKKLHDVTKMSENELEEQRLQAANNPNIVDNARHSDAISDAYATLLKTSKKFSACKERFPRRVVQDGVAIALHSDLDWSPEPIDAVDLVTEPQCSWDPSLWTTFFVIKKMPSQEAAKHIREETPFWKPKALRWALETAILGATGILDRRHTANTTSIDKDKVCGENFMVQSYYANKSSRVNNIASYYGNMFVVETYMYNAKGKVDKIIFYPSSLFAGTSKEIKAARESYDSKNKDHKLDEVQNALGADVLFYRPDVFDTMSEAISVIPADRAEPTLERQRFLGHHLFSPIECIMRTDSSILNLTMLMGAPFVKNTVQGTDAQDLEDLEIAVNGDVQDLGDRTFVESPIAMDLNGLLAVRSALLQHVTSLCFLGGLDGQEMNANGRGAQLANLRLVRDSRVHKHHVEDFANGLQGFLTTVFKRVLDLSSKFELTTDLLLKTKFYSQLVEVEGVDKSLLEYSDKDVLEDTNLPYWLDLSVIRNGSSHFGAAEVFLLSEIKAIYGDGLTQQQLQKLNRTAIRSMLGPEDSLDILGDPREENVVAQEQVYRARMENGSILGSVDQSALNYEPIMVLPDKDDHVAHLREAHLPKIQEILQLLQEGEVTPDMLQELSEDQLDTRTTLILKLAALANHARMHTDMLDRFGSSREDVLKLKEEANFVLQAAEGLLNSLQINLRALNQKRVEKEMRLQNISPENQVEKEKIELERLDIQRQMAADRDKLALANKIADQKQMQHLDKQVSKARDRELKKAIALRDGSLAREDQRLQESQNNFQNQIALATSFGGGVKS